MKRKTLICLVLLLALLSSGAGVAESTEPEEAPPGLTLWEPVNLSPGSKSLIGTMPDNSVAILPPWCFLKGELDGFSASREEDCRFMKLVWGERRFYLAFPGGGGQMLIGEESGDRITWSGPGSRDGVRIAMLGDSVLAGQLGGMPPYVLTSHPIPDTVSRELGVPVDNLAVGGMGWASTQYWPENIQDYIRKLDLSGYSMVVLQFGHNDDDYPLGTYLDTKEVTVMGAVFRVCRYLHEQYPGLQVVLSTPTLRKGVHGEFPDWDFTVPNQSGWSARDLRDEFRLFCDCYHVPLIEGDKCFNAWNVEDLLGDHVHPNEEGYLVAGRYFAGQIGALI